MAKNIKKRNWAFVLYPESAPADWREQLQKTGLQCAISPLHDKDMNPDNTPKKPHYHVILTYSGPTSYNVVKALTDGFNQPIPQALEQVRGYYRYLTHKDNPEKAQYDENILNLARKDSSIFLYKNAHTVSELYEAWKETYEQRFSGDIIFRDDSVAYDIGVKPLRKKDLKDFSENDKIVNRFEEILRHNNVSDKENAFNRLIALFICKLVDEIQKTDDDIVEFQYKVGTDTYESLQDRLQRLHKEGMEKFMREKIFYVADDYAENLVKQYTKQRRVKMIEELRNTLRILKFYTNNDFAFKDVHNEELFYQNGKILVEMVQLFQDYRIIGSSDVQMLGDLFEQLLNKGFKQNEGQFFTPTPITRFIWDSLPLEQIMTKSDGIEWL